MSDDPLAQVKAMDKAIAEAQTARTEAPPATAPEPSDPMPAAVEATNQQRGAAFIRDVLDKAGVSAEHDGLFAGAIYQHLNSLNGQPADVDAIVNAVAMQARQMRGLKRIVPSAQRERNLKLAAMSDREFADHMRAQRGR